MNERAMERVIRENFDESPYTALTAMLLGSKSRFKSMYTAEERAEMKRLRLLRESEEQRCSLIRQNICPSCHGSLVRGKKDKKNEYKRSWNCSPCNEQHFI